MARQQITENQVNFSKTTDANGWTVYDYGSWKRYTKRFVMPAQTMGTGGALITLTGNNLPSGVSTVGSHHISYAIMLSAGSPFLVTNLDGDTTATTVKIGAARFTSSSSFSGNVYVELTL